jgi:hypothetical protein
MGDAPGEPAAQSKPDFFRYVNPPVPVFVVHVHILDVSSEKKTRPRSLNSQFDE